MDSGARLPGLKSQLWHLLSLWFWTSYINFLCLSFLIWKMVVVWGLNKKIMFSELTDFLFFSWISIGRWNNFLLSMPSGRKKKKIIANHIGTLNRGKKTNAMVNKISLYNLLKLLRSFKLRKNILFKNKKTKVWKFKSCTQKSRV